MTDMAEIETQEALAVDVAGDETVAGAGNDTIEAQAQADTFSVEIGDAPSPDQEDNGAPDWVRKVREENRELKRKVKELEQKPAQATVADIGPKPTHESVGYDDDLYDSALLDWHEKKRAQDAQTAKAREAQDALESDYQSKQQDYFAKREAIKAKVRDYDDAEEFVKAALEPNQQGVLVRVAENPEVMVLALARHPDKLKDLAKITDPLVLAAAIAKLEVKLNVTTRKPPAPEGRVTGASTGGGSIDPSKMSGAEYIAWRNGGGKP